MNAKLCRLMAAVLFLSACAAAAQSKQPPNGLLKVHIIAGGEYSPVESMREFKKHLEANFHVECTTSFFAGTGSPSKLENLDSLTSADVLVLFARRMSLRAEQMKLVRAYWEQGKPIVGIRTASHSFQKADNEIIDRELFGGHYGGGPSSSGGYRTAVAKGQEERFAHGAAHNR